MQGKAQALITRLPYALKYDAQAIMDQAQNVDERGLICLSVPTHVDNPNGAMEFAQELEKKGMVMVAVVAWYRDRHIVTQKSKRLTNSWEHLFIMSRSKNYILNRENASKVKKGYETKDTAFDEDEYLTCIGDHWPVRNDRRDRRFLPQTVVLNCAQLADLNPGDAILDPFGNPGVRDTCELFDWIYIDGGLPSDVRGLKKNTEEKGEEDEKDEKEVNEGT